MPHHSVFAQILATDPRRQVRFPDAPLEQALAEWQALLGSNDSAKEAVDPAAAQASAAASREAALLEGLGVSLAALATHVWRARAKMIEPGASEPKEEMKRVYRHMQGAFEVFEQMGLTLNDWLEQPYDAGLPVKVLAFQPTPGVTRDTVVEAVRPTVIWKDRLLQLGEVIVGIPMNSETPST